MPISECFSKTKNPNFWVLYGNRDRVTVCWGCDCLAPKYFKIYTVSSFPVSGASINRKLLWTAAIKLKVITFKKGFFPLRNSQKNDFPGVLTTDNLKFSNVQKNIHLERKKSWYSHLSNTIVIEFRSRFGGHFFTISINAPLLEKPKEVWTYL